METTLFLNRGKATYIMSLKTKNRKAKRWKTGNEKATRSKCKNSSTEKSQLRRRKNEILHKSRILHKNQASEEPSDSKVRSFWIIRCLDISWGRGEIWPAKMQVSSKTKRGCLRKHYEYQLSKPTAILKLKRDCQARKAKLRIRKNETLQEVEDHVKVA